MPNRILKESICYSDDLDRLTAFEETVFYRLMVRVDDYGRLDARPAFLRSQLFTTRTDITEAQLRDAADRLAEVGLIAYYTVADRLYLYICNWQKHQRLRCTREKYPPPPGEAGTADSTPQQGDALPDAQPDAPVFSQPAAICGKLPQTAATGGEWPQADETGGKLPQMAARAGAESESESQSESEVESGNDTQGGARRFIPPTVKQVADYCRQRNNGIIARRFVDFYASKGWRIGTSPMVDWRAAVRRWEEQSSSTVCGGPARASPREPCRLSTAKKYESEDCI